MPFSFAAFRQPTVHMFNQIRRHQKWLWVFISVTVIISFVWYFNPDAQNATRSSVPGARSVVGMADGLPVTKEEFEAARNQALMGFLFRFGEPYQGTQVHQQLYPLDSETATRLILARRAAAQGIVVDNQSVADWILRAFSDPQTKTFRREVYENFVNDQLGRLGYRPADFERYVRGEVARAHLLTLAGVSGKLVAPQQIENAFRKENRQADTKAVFFQATNYLSMVEVTPAAISNHYNIYGSSFREPERVQLSYVSFHATNHMEAAESFLSADTNLAQRIDAIYSQRGTNYFTDMTGQLMTLDAARARIREELANDFALIEAQKRANEFVELMLSNTNKPSAQNPAENLETLAVDKGYLAQVTEPFSQFESPRGINAPSQFGRMAFGLSPENPTLEEPVVGQETVYVVAFKKRIPSALPPLETIQGRVTEDFRRVEADKLTRAAGNEFAIKVEAGLAAGKTFDQIALESGHTVDDLAPFKPTARFIPGLDGRADAGSFAAAAFDTAEGKASGFRMARGGGYVVFVERILPVTEEELKEGLPAFAEQMRKTTESQAMSNWVRKELELAQVQLPGMRGGVESAAQ